MCAHACSFHKKKGGYITPCCVPCSCGENIEMAKLEAHLGNCHRASLDVPRIPIFALPPSSVGQREPAYAGTAA